MYTHKIAGGEFRLSEWGEVVKERIAGGQSVDAFCKEKTSARPLITIGRKKYGKLPEWSLWRNKSAEPGLCQY